MNLLMFTPFARALTHGEYRVWSYLASDATNDGRRKFTSVPKLAEWARVDIETVLLVMRRAAVHGYFQVLERRGNPPRPFDWQLRIPGCGKVGAKAVDAAADFPVSSLGSDRPRADGYSPAADPVSARMTGSASNDEGSTSLPSFFRLSSVFKEEEKAPLRVASSSESEGNSPESDGRIPVAPAPVTSSQLPTRTPTLDEVRAGLAMLRARLDASAPAAKRSRTR